jgi:inosine triphosphate pyrophosphatase
VQANELRTILDQTGATNASDGEGPPTASLVQLRVVTVDLPEIQEVDTEAVAKDKALIASQLAGGPAVVEDTALHFHALGGMPGPFIKWFQDSLGSDGLYNILAAYPDKSATAVCTLAFCPAPHADPVLFTGECRGAIVAPVPGAGFGYVYGSAARRAAAFVLLAFLTALCFWFLRNSWDSIFVPDGFDRPFSKMTTEEKCQVSHRGAAVRQWAEWLDRNRDALYQRQEGHIRAIGHKGLNFKIKSPEQ